ncbi:hypothetical protein [Peribacillus simplex]|nr:hypothetical protein [Peribacillus simplex]
MGNLDNKVCAAFLTDWSPRPYLGIDKHISAALPNIQLKVDWPFKGIFSS